MTQSSECAVVFTHIDVRNQLEVPAGFQEFYDTRGSFFRSCLRCRNIGIVFVYSSYGIGAYINAVRRVVRPSVVQRSRSAAIPFSVVDGEQRIYDALQLAVDRAAAEIASETPEAPQRARQRFVFIGVRELACHLTRLQRQDADLVDSLAYRENFTYDSPKYAEAIIRLRRPDDTVIRVDADVEVNEEAIARILKAARALRQTPGKKMWWFSGSYSGNFAGDPVNEYAVRQHWLIDPATRNDRTKFALLAGGQRFLLDLGEVGATQIALQPPPQPNDPRLSPGAGKLIAARGATKSRQTPQVISGAGLVASVGAIRRLPPFMNAKTMVVWIDDHLKRQLHEAIGDLQPSDTERVPGAVLKQDRYAGPITQRDVEWARDAYFLRLLHGCLLEATIKTADGKRGPLAAMVYRIMQEDYKPTDADYLALRRDLRAAAKQRLKEVLAVWGSADYGDPEKLLQTWAKGFTKRGKTCSMIADVGETYARLCVQWPSHREAIGALDEAEAYWLFTKLPEDC
jgi:hypothetical protein